MRKLSFAGLLLFAASIPLEDSLRYGVGRISKLLGALLFAAWFLALARNGLKRRPTIVHIWASAFVAWAALSYFWTLAPGPTVAKITTLVQMLAIVFVVYDLVADHSELVVVMRAFLLGSFGSAVVTFLNAQSGNAAEGTVRFASANAGPNNTGCILAIAVMIACYAYRVEDRRWRWCYRLLVPTLAMGALFTASRTALLAMALGGMVLVFTKGNFTPARLTGMALAALLGLFLVSTYVPTGSITRLLTTDDEISAGTLNNRTTYWERSFEVWGDHPVNGVGAGAFASQNEILGGVAAVAHNAFISITVELGAVGIGLWLAMLGAAVLGLGAAPPRVRRAWTAIGLAWAVGASGLTWEVRKITWFLLALAVVLGRILSEERQEALQDESSPVTQEHDESEAPVPVPAGQ